MVIIRGRRRKSKDCFTTVFHLVWHLSSRPPQATGLPQKSDLELYFRFQILHLILFIFPSHWAGTEIRPFQDFSITSCRLYLSQCWVKRGQKEVVAELVAKGIRVRTPSHPTRCRCKCLCQHHDIMHLAHCNVDDNSSFCFKSPYISNESWIRFNHNMIRNVVSMGISKTIVSYMRYDNDQDKDSYSCQCRDDHMRHDNCQQTLLQRSLPVPKQHEVWWGLKDLLIQASVPRQWTQWRSVDPQVTRKGVTRIWTWITFCRSSLTSTLTLLMVIIIALIRHLFVLQGWWSTADDQWWEIDDRDLFVLQGRSNGEPEVNIPWFPFHPFPWTWHQSNLKSNESLKVH